MDSMKAARITSAINYVIGFLQGVGQADGRERFLELAQMLERNALEPLMEEFAKDE